MKPKYSFSLIEGFSWWFPRLLSGCQASGGLCRQRISQVPGPVDWCRWLARKGISTSMATRAVGKSSLEDDRWVFLKSNQFFQLGSLWFPAIPTAGLDAPQNGGEAKTLASMVDTSGLGCNPFFWGAEF